MPTQASIYAQKLTQFKDYAVRHPHLKLNANLKSQRNLHHRTMQLQHLSLHPHL